MFSSLRIMYHRRRIHRQHNRHASNFLGILTCELFKRQILGQMKGTWTTGILATRCLPWLYNIQGVYVIIVILNIYISQGNVAPQLRCSGMYSNRFITHFPQNVSVKKFWKSVNIWQRYGQSLWLTFLGHPVGLCQNCSYDGGSAPDTAEGAYSATLFSNSCIRTCVCTVHQQVYALLKQSLTPHTTI